MSTAVGGLSSLALFAQSSSSRLGFGGANDMAAAAIRPAKTASEEDPFASGHGGAPEPENAEGRELVGPLRRRPGRLSNEIRVRPARSSCQTGGASGSGLLYLK